MFPKDVMDTDVLKKYIPDYKINLIDASNVHCVENFHSDLQQIFGMLKCRGNKRDLVEYIRKNQWYFRNVDEDTHHVIRELLHSERILKKEVSSANGEENADMCKALEELYNDGYELGMSKGAIDKSNEIIKNMERICNFLKEAGVYYLATMDGDQPRVRPFGTALVFEGKLYIQTGKVKPVSKQLAVNPKAEICAFKDGVWLRIAGELVEDSRVEAKKAMLDEYSNLRAMYDENDGNTQVLYFKNAFATFSSFTAPEEVIEF